MTATTTTVRALGALSAGMLALGMLAACTPEPAPKPKPTKTQLFASDEEAFAAAERTYRAYTDALNNVDTSDPKTFEPAFEETTGDFQSRDKKNLSTMHAEGFTLTGNTVVRGFHGLTTSGAFAQVVGCVTVDVSDTDITDETGASIVPDDRPDTYTAVVTFVQEGDGLLISHADDDREKKCAD
ncbi:hypothetical protein Q9R19_11060 [Microbacterium sp. ARD32]|uniref:hypothetical protein n=1 Tax=Microbacterium sp. ARD32 TaxID=2962577 RepID=UPI002881F6CA|nr:hypothetical protein [Microbacterium sp. ARD32]MDT0158164.1 hypothetical protein [Microbacterium sp. ARD32]